MGKKILVVDDQLSIHVLMKHIFKKLKDQGIELLLAADGKKALKLVMEEHPDLIFLDVMMPNLNGYEVCQRIKAADSGTYVILLTGQNVELKRGAEVGADECITKPFYPNQILKRAVTVLGLDVVDKT